MFDELEKYTVNGHFFFKMSDSLAEVSKKVPELPGVYYILRLAKGRVDLVYIGKSGTPKRGSKVNEPLLSGSINSRQDGLMREDYYRLRMAEEHADALDVYWFVTMDDEHQSLPEHVERLLLEQYSQLYGALPPWNKSY